MGLDTTYYQPAPNGTPPTGAPPRDVFPSFSVRYGLFDNLDLSLQLSLTGLFSSIVSSMNRAFALTAYPNANIEAKFALLPLESNWQLSLVAGFGATCLITNGQGLFYLGGHTGAIASYSLPHGFVPYAGVKFNVTTYTTGNGTALFFIPAIGLEYNRKWLTLVLESTLVIHPQEAIHNAPPITYTTLFFTLSVAFTTSLRTQKRP